MFNKLSKKWLVVVTSLLLVTAVIFTACSSATTVTTTTPQSTPTTTSPAVTTANTPIPTTSTSIPTPTSTASPTTSTTIATTSTPAITSTTTTTATTSTTPLPIVALNGAGGTFPAPLYTKMICCLRYTHQRAGKLSSRRFRPGITAITNNTVDFGASDAIMTSAQVSAAQASGNTLLTIPTTIGAVAIAL